MYHMSSKFDYAAENWRHLERHFTPEYTPNDNSMEGQWKAVKAAISNVSIHSRGRMSEALGNAVRAGEMPPVVVFNYERVGSRRLDPRPRPLKGYISLYRVCVLKV